MSFLNHITRITETQSIEELWALHVEKMREYGFDRLIYGFTRYSTAHSFGNLDDVLILSNHSAEYLDGFIHSGLYQHAPMVNWAAKNAGACSWRWVEDMVRDNALSAEALNVVAFNQRMGLRAGYTISFCDESVRNTGAIGLTAEPQLSQDDVDDIWAEHGREIHSINSITHLKIMSLPYLAPRRSLTSRQREVLEWVGDGKTVQDTATIMGLTVATVEKHLRLARHALGVETTTQAVLKAAYQNQIFIIGR